MEKDRVYFARKYGLAENQIEPEHFPLLLAFDGVSEQNEKLAELNRQLIEKVEKVTNPVTNEHYYDGMTAGSAFFLRWGWGVWVFGLGIILAGTWLLAAKNRADLDKDRLELERMRRVLIADTTGAYRISSDHYRIAKEKGFKGVVVIIPEK
jgi:hypothetical protein